MKPSSLRMSEIAAFTRDAGMSTVLWLAVFALRMRVRRSATGSVIAPIMLYSLLPRRLGYAGNDAFVRVLAEADAAHGELTQITARATAQLATIVRANAEFRRLLRFDD